MKLNTAIFKGIFDNWKHDWKTNKPLFFLELIGTLGCMMAAGSLAFMAPKPDLLIVYSFYLVGSTTLALSSYLRNNGFWVVLNLFFMTVDLIGIYNTCSGSACLARLLG